MANQHGVPQWKGPPPLDMYLQELAEALEGWTIIKVSRNRKWTAGLVFLLEKGGQRKLVGTGYDGSNAPTFLDFTKKAKQKKQQPLPRGNSE